MFSAAQVSRGVGVLDRGRERVLGRQAVVDADDHGADARAEQPAHALVGVEVADHEAAAVEVDDRRYRAVGVRAVDPHRHRRRLSRR